MIIPTPRVALWTVIPLPWRKLSEDQSRYHTEKELEMRFLNSKGMTLLASEDEDQQFLPDSLSNLWGRLPDYLNRAENAKR
jgi:hypothetical protein